MTPYRKIKELMYDEYADSWTWQFSEVSVSPDSLARQIERLASTPIDQSEKEERHHERDAYKLLILKIATEYLSPTMFRAFVLKCVLNLPLAERAAQLGLTKAQTPILTNNAILRIRTIIKKMANGEPVRNPQDFSIKKFHDVDPHLKKAAQRISKSVRNQK